MTTDQVSGNAHYLTVGIDATNLMAGGGRTHLIELLGAADPTAFGIGRVIVWGSQGTLALLDDRPWVEKIAPPELEGSLLKRTLWQRFHLSAVARAAGCGVLFVPGGSYAGDFHPVVSMSRNMLPFEWGELLRYGWSVRTLKLILLRKAQQRTFRLADGLIFLTDYAKKGVEKVTVVLPRTATIPHGLNERFFQPPREHKPIETYTGDQPFRILYVSVINMYKHQWHVVEGIARLRKSTGWPLILELVGPAYPPALRRLQAAIDQYDSGHAWVRYNGPASFDRIHSIYKEADLGLFASSCENMPNILLETMASGLPVASSNRGPMPEILQDAGVYFDPESPSDIARALEGLIADPQLRRRYAESSYSASRQYTWKRCANETFAFISEAYRQHVGEHTSCAG